MPRMADFQMRRMAIRASHGFPYPASPEQEQIVEAELIRTLPLDRRCAWIAECDGPFDTAERRRRVVACCAIDPDRAAMYHRRSL